MVDHYNVIITLTLILPMVTLLTMAESRSSMEDIRQYIEIPYASYDNAHGRQVDRLAGYIRRLTGPAATKSQLLDLMLKRWERMGDDKLINQFDNQRANLDSLLAGRGLNMKREGAETYKNMFLGVRG